MSTTPTSVCPSCSKENPVGAKFCSACAVSLVAEPASPPPSSSPQPPPPPPPSRPGLGGMLGQTGGKVEQRQVNGDPASLYAAVENFINAREGSVIKTQFPPQQITAGIVFKDFMATMNAPVKVDSEINIAPTGPGVSTVTVGGKADFGSATSLWIFSLIMFLVGFLFISALLFIILGIGSAVFQVYLLNSRGPRIVADELFEYLNKQVSHTAPSQDMSHDSAASAPAPKSSPMVAEAGNGAATQKNGAAPSTLTQRIRKLDELKDEGLINDEEYNTRRMEILQEI